MVDNKNSQGGPADSGSNGAAELIRVAGATDKPTRLNFADVLNEINATKLGEGSGFDRDPFVTVTYLGYFNPPIDVFMTELTAKDSRFSKEWEYINAAGVWNEIWLLAVSLIRTTAGDTE